jgi:hypothetical protein
LELQHNALGMVLNGVLFKGMMHLLPRKSVLEGFLNSKWKMDMRNGVGIEHEMGYKWIESVKYCTLNGLFMNSDRSALVFSTDGKELSLMIISSVAQFFH